MDILAVITELTSDVSKAGVTLLVKGLLGEQIEELANVSKRGLRNLGSAVKTIYDKWQAKNINLEENVKEADPEILQPILKEVFIGYKSEILREKWINLLESVILGNSVHPRYIETLKLLDTIDANVLNIISEYRKVGNFLNIKSLKGSLQQGGLDVQDDMAIDSLFNLVEINLCYVNTLQGKPTRQDVESGNNVYISDFGKKFMRLVNGEN
ncbi:MAG: Abi-alpha family protein [Nostoc sp.]|uniref:Abi-alpha family protein n=1 Tax=Nostoc sp. TaxID=1180 RepID=UPI002FF8B94B